MSEMVERVGLVIMKADGCGMTNDAGKRVFCNDSSIPDGIRGEGPCECQQTARAAIEAMREPTDEMVQSGVSEDQTDDVYRDIRGIFGAMIDAALQD